MQTILVPTDFSNNAAEALRYAVNIAHKNGLNILLVHVYETPQFERYLAEEEVQGLSGEAVNKIFNAFLDDHDIRDMAGGAEISIETRLLRGKTVPEIVKLAEEINPVLVVCGAQGSGSTGWKDPWLGGTANKLIRQVAGPVMVVPPQVKFHGIDKIGYATAFRTGDFDLMPNLVALARIVGATVHVVHIKSESVAVVEPSLNYLRRNYTGLIQEGVLHFEVVENQNIFAGIKHYITDNGISVLAVLKRRQNFLERWLERSDSIDIAFSAGVPTIVFKED